MPCRIFTRRAVAVQQSVRDRWGPCSRVHNAGHKVDEHLFCILQCSQLKADATTSRLVTVRVSPGGRHLLHQTSHYYPTGATPSRNGAPGAASKHKTTMMGEKRPRHPCVSRSPACPHPTGPLPVAAARRSALSCAARLHLSLASTQPTAYPHGWIRDSRRSLMPLALLARLARAVTHCDALPRSPSGSPSSRSGRSLLSISAFSHLIYYWPQKSQAVSRSHEP